MTNEKTDYGSEPYGAYGQCRLGGPAEKFMQNDGIKLLTGIIFSNVAGATVPDILDNGGIYISPNAGPSTFAGEACDPNYFVVSWQNDALHEAAGAAAKELGYTKAVALAPNYQAGKDAIEGSNGCLAAR